MGQFSATGKLDAHGRTLAPLVARHAEHRLRHAPDCRDRDDGVVEGTKIMTALPQRDGLVEHPCPHNEATHLRTIVIALPNHQGLTAHQSATLHCSQRIAERPVRGNAKVQRQRIGLAAGKHDQHRPAVAENARAAGQYVPHRTVAAIDREIIHPFLCKIGQHGRQFAAAVRRCQQHVLPQFVSAATPLATAVAVPFVAMTAAVADQTHQRPRANGRYGNVVLCGRNRVDLRQAVEEMNASVHNLLALTMGQRQLLRLLQQLRHSAAPTGADLQQVARAMVPTRHE